MPLQDFQAWKLHTWQDYTYFFLMLISCFVVFYLITRNITKRRNDASACKRVRKKLKIKGAKVYHDATFEINGQRLHFDHLLVDAAGIVAVRSIGWGIRIYGSAEDDTWKAADNKHEDVKIDNPIRVLQKTFDPLLRYLAQGNIYGVNIEPLAVFADPFAPPELYLGRDSNCIAFTQLGSWVKQRRMRAAGKSAKLDVNAVSEQLDKALVK